MIKQHGFTLTELLMVLFGIAVILLLSIHRYRVYQRSIEMAGVRSDVKRVRQALNRYYHIEGCQSNGTFVGSPSPSMFDLGLSLSGHPPIVPIAAEAYSARIVNTGQKTIPSGDTEKEKNEKGKPVYVLQVQAKLNDHNTTQEMKWYQKALGADESIRSNTLTWTVLPSNTAAAPGTQLWVLKSGAAQFRKMENELQEKLAPKKLANSSSYCAH